MSRNVSSDRPSRVESGGERREGERGGLTRDAGTVERLNDRLLLRLLLVRETRSEVRVGDGVLGESLVGEDG
jgi:hypothetical protein